MFKTINDVDWKKWKPDIKATLMFIIKNDEVLLIHKKTGLGIGKINGPGGKIETNESSLECSIRETQEEVCVTPEIISKSGELYFQFTDELKIHCIVYRAENLIGIPKETREAKPFWCSINKIPYDQMWEDDVTWFKYLIKKKYFNGKYIFKKDQMLDSKVEFKK